jgi:hypothetical protein
MRYDAASDHCVRFAWDRAYAAIRRELWLLESPNHAEFIRPFRCAIEDTMGIRLRERWRGETIGLGIGPQAVTAT